LSIVCLVLNADYYRARSLTFLLIENWFSNVRIFSTTNIHSTSVPTNSLNSNLHVVFELAVPSRLSKFGNWMQRQ